MFAALAALSFVTATADEPKLSDAAEKDLKKFEGEWKIAKVVAGEVEETPMMDGAEVFLEFKGRKMMLGDKEIAAITALDPSTDPKLFDFKGLIDLGQLKKDTVYESIYKFDGDNLILAITMGETRKRPAKFEADKESGTVLITLKREKK
jgi:uncharacterized protein (TIGR03067 family)